MEELLLTAIIAIVSAIISTIEISRRGTQEINEEKLTIAIFVGLVVGAVSAYMGISYDAATQLLVSAGAILAIEAWAKTLYRKIKTTLKA